MNIVNGSELSIDDLAPYMTDILKQMGRLAKRFPKDVTTAALFQEFLSGKKILWLVLDGEAFVSMVMTNVKTVDATGTRIATLCDLAGRDVPAYAPELFAALDHWAGENNCSVKAIEGRPGWGPLLAEFGFKPFAVLYRKG